MKWPTWDQAAVATVVLGAVWLATRRSSRDRVRLVSAMAQELALVAFLYAIWRLARQLPLTHEPGAEERGRWIWEFQQSVHLPSELAMEQWVMRHDLLAHLTVWYYASLHVPSLIAFLIWLWVRHPEAYPRWRNALAVATGGCLFLRFIRVAPPRLLPDLGFVDLPAALGRDIYGPIGTGASDQYAAMPSIHVAWAVVVGVGVFTVARSRWRWIGLAHVALTFWAVMATANHWWLDGIVAAALVGIGLVADDVVRGAVRRRRDRRDQDGSPAPDGEPVVDLVASG